MTKRKLKRLVRKAYMKGAYCSCQNKPWEEMVIIEPEFGFLHFNFDYPPNEKGGRSSGTIVEALTAEKYHEFILDGRNQLFLNRQQLLENRRKKWHLKY